MFLLLVLEYALIVLVVVGVFTQLVLPLVKGDKIFPLFRRKPSDLGKSEEEAVRRLNEARRRKEAAETRAEAARIESEAERLEKEADASDRKE